MKMFQIKTKSVMIYSCYGNAFSPTFTDSQLAVLNDFKKGIF